MRCLPVLTLLIGLASGGCNCCLDKELSKATEQCSCEAASEGESASAREAASGGGGGAAQAAPDKDWGAIKGRIVFAGDKLPVPGQLKVDKDPNHCLAKGNLFSEEWVVNKENKGVRWVFVWLAPDPAGEVKKLPIHPALKAPKEKKVEIDQPCCMFVPHALAMREGQILVGKNSSPIPHNMYVFGHPLKNPAQNPIIPSGGSYEFKLQTDDWPVTIQCSIHGWMNARVRVFDHPYYAVTDADGNFEIKQAPPGEWRLIVWHDSGWRGGAKGKTGEKITVKGGAVTDLGKLDLKPNP